MYSSRSSAAQPSIHIFHRPPKGVPKYFFGRRKQYPDTSSAAGRRTQVLLRPPEGVPGYFFGRRKKEVLRYSFGRRKEYPGTLSAAGKSIWVLLLREHYCAPPLEAILESSFGKRTFQCLKFFASSSCFQNFITFVFFNARQIDFTISISKKLI